MSPERFAESARIVRAFRFVELAAVHRFYSQRHPRPWTGQARAQKKRRHIRRCGSHLATPSRHASAPPSSAALEHRPPSLPLRRRPRVPRPPRAPGRHPGEPRSTNPESADNDVVLCNILSRSGSQTPPRPQAFRNVLGVIVLCDAHAEDPTLRSVLGALRELKKVPDSPRIRPRYASDMHRYVLRFVPNTPQAFPTMMVARCFAFSTRDEAPALDLPPVRDGDAPITLLPPGGALFFEGDTHILRRTCLFRYRCCGT